VFEGRPGYWDARGSRITAEFYDGRASKEENWFERTGAATPTGNGRQLESVSDQPAATPRYVEPLALPGGGYRIFYEAVLPDERHELRTELIPASHLDG
jgi:hypothetical protein